LPLSTTKVPLGCILLTIRSIALALMILLCPALVWSQASALGEQTRASQPQPNQSLSNTGTSASQTNAAAQAKPHTAELPSAPAPNGVGQKTSGSNLKQSHRIFGIMPNFSAVNPNAQLPRLTTHQKFVLALHDSFDYSSFVITGILSANSLRTNSYPELGSGAAGFGRYYWRAFTDQVSGTYFTEAIVPTLTHEDPRYYTLGKDGFLRRTGYALSRVFVTKNDAGGEEFNTSEVGGDALEAGVANLYYPAQERGVVKTTENWSTQLIVTGAANVLKEFWPDIRKNILLQKN